MIVPIVQANERLHRASNIARCYLLSSTVYCSLGTASAAMQHADHTRHILLRLKQSLNQKKEKFDTCRVRKTSVTGVEPEAPASKVCIFTILPLHHQCQLPILTQTYTCMLPPQYITHMYNKHTCTHVCACACRRSCARACMR